MPSEPGRMESQDWKVAFREAMFGGFGTERLRRANDLLLEIARCPVALGCLEGIASPCSAVVGTQGSNQSDFHIPEPWSGHIVGAPLLFLSSNPSIGRPTEAYPIGEDYPLLDWGDEDTISFFQERFDGYWIREGNKSRQADGTYPPRGTAFWSAVRNRAWEILGREPRPGIDYALSEVVHCKSASEAGVWPALATCSGLYLKRVIEAAGAPVVVVLGKTAAYAVRNEFGLGSSLWEGPVEIAERPRMFAFLPHPNARQPNRTFRCWPSEQLTAVRTFLNAQWGGGLQE